MYNFYLDENDILVYFILKEFDNYQPDTKLKVVKGDSLPVIISEKVDVKYTGNKNDMWEYVEREVQ